ncbi:hypothetical protein D3C87_1239200 [compost metagenome]
MDDVVTTERRYRHISHILQAQLGGQFGVGGADLVEALLAELDQIHLVDGHDHVLDLQQLQDGRVALGLRQQFGPAVLHGHARGVHQHDGGVRRAGAGHHVAGVLLVARRVGDDELAARGGEVAVGHVDGDALLALGFQAVGQQRKIDLLAGGALVLGVGQRGQLVGEHGLAVIQQAADQRALAVVHGTRGDKAQQALVQCLLSHDIWSLWSLAAA